MQFLASMPEPLRAPCKKEEPAKLPKKKEEGFNLLSLFKKAIENVTDEPSKLKSVEPDIAGRQI